VVRALRTAGVLLAAAGLVLAAGCRRGKDEQEPSPATPASSTAAATAEPASPTPVPATPAFEAGPRAETGQLTVDGRERTYRLYVPGSLTGAPSPLVIGLHGGGLGTGEQFARNTHFDRQAETGAFLAVYPDGTGAAQTWNAGACCGYATRNNVDDVRFILALVEEIAGRYPVDGKRVYAVGHSNGGMMALRLGCEAPERFAAVGVVAGSLETSCPGGIPVPVLVIHGDADENHPIEGGSGPNSLSGEDFNSVAATMETLRAVNGCTAGVETEARGGVTTTRWDCPEGVEVVLKVIEGGSHAWPGGTRAIPNVIGEPSKALDATAELWAFLGRFGR
jgi:polyhydroxybutyrate depolymerase